ncbi:MAG: DUF2069 domain-containing protein [Sulfurifustaceae bacterium]
MTEVDTRLRATRAVALAAYGLLLVAIVLWEAWAAPATPVARTFWLGLKAIPLLVPLPGLWRGRARVYVLASLLALLYFCDGIAVAYDALRSNAPEGFVYGTAQTLLALVFVVAATFYARFTWRRSPLRGSAETES